MDSTEEYFCIVCGKQLFSPQGNAACSFSGKTDRTVQQVSEGVIPSAHVPIRETHTLYGALSFRSAA
jgi:uncharacterized Zn finger protein (UPF0148 family)